jgi:nucleotide-binding universal stress UspA family protein
MEDFTMKILLAVDGSPCSEFALIEVARRPWPTGSEVKVISVVDTPNVLAVEPWAVPPTYFEDVMKDVREAARVPVERAVTKLRAGEDKTLKVTSEIIEGSPKREILDEAERWGADLIVVGSHGYGALNRFLLGSVSQAVALHAKCSVEIVRSPEACESEKK